MKTNKNIKELICYVIIVIILLILSFLNNKYWKLGKKEKVQNNPINYKQDLLQVNNITYNVPYEEMWLD